MKHVIVCFHTSTLFKNIYQHLYACTITLNVNIKSASASAMIFFSAPLSISIIEHALGIELPPIPSVGLSVCRYGKCIVAKRLIGFGCRFRWWMGVLDGMVSSKGKGQFWWLILERPIVTNGDGDAFFPNYFVKDLLLSRPILRHETGDSSGRYSPVETVSTWDVRTRQLLRCCSCWQWRHLTR